MLCLQTARKGGLSSIASSTTIHNEMLKQRPDLVEVANGARVELLTACVVVCVLDIFVAAILANLLNVKWTKEPQ